MKQETNRILDNLRKYILADSQWLTQIDIDAIVMKVDELKTFIDKKYRKLEEGQEDQNA